MKVIRTIKEYKSILQTLDRNCSIGFVPTMGCLHKGHLSLVELVRHCQVVVVSIFVNSAQFASNEDFDKYPNTIDSDIQKLEAQGIATILFVPSQKELRIDFAADRPSGTMIDNYSNIRNLLESAYRPFFFRGVMTVVMKLIHIVCPTVIVFGQKDAQQCAYIRHMIDDLNIDCEMLIGELHREDNGLAMSSRNELLKKNEKEQAAKIFASLCKLKKLFLEGEKRSSYLKNVLKSELAEFNVQYVSIASIDTLEELDHVTDKALVSLAVFIRDVRLIDNIVIGE